MSARGRKPRQPRPRAVEPVNLKPLVEATFAAVDATTPAAPDVVGPGGGLTPPSAHMIGRIVKYRINITGVDEYRPAIVIRDDDYGVCTLYVFTLPGDIIAAAAKIAQMRAIARPIGTDVGCWQSIPNVT